jgi:hypothetical protein
LGSLGSTGWDEFGWGEFGELKGDELELCDELEVCERLLAVIEELEVCDGACAFRPLPVLLPGSGAGGWINESVSCPAGPTCSKRQSLPVNGSRKRCRRNRMLRVVSRSSSVCG